MSIRIRAVLKPEYTDVRVLVTHPMETGLRRDDAGKLVRCISYKPWCCA